LPLSENNSAGVFIDFVRSNRSLPETVQRFNDLTLYR